MELERISHTRITRREWKSSAKFRDLNRGELEAKYPLIAIYGYGSMAMADLHWNHSKVWEELQGSKNSHQEGHQEEELPPICRIGEGLETDQEGPESKDRWYFEVDHSEERSAGKQKWANNPGWFTNQTPLLFRITICKLYWDISFLDLGYE